MSAHRSMEPRDRWGEPPEQTVQMDTFPPEFYERADSSPDPAFYFRPRFVTHIDDQAIAAVGVLYDELGIAGQVLDLMGSWVSHFRTPPARLTVLGMNSDEVEANPAASVTVVHDLNADPRLPFADATFDGVVCCVSVDYLTPSRGGVHRRRPGASTWGTFRLHVLKSVFPDQSNSRLAVRALTSSTAPLSDSTSGSPPGWGQPHSERRTPLSHPGDPLLAVWAYRTDAAVS